MVKFPSSRDKINAVCVVCSLSDCFDV